jgi:hypothetical protein
LNISFYWYITGRVVVEVELGVVDVVAFDCVVGTLANDAEVVLALLAIAVVGEFVGNVWSMTSVADFEAEELF